MKTLWLEFENDGPWQSTNILKQSYLELYQNAGLNPVVKTIKWDDYLNPEFWSSIAALPIDTVILADMRFDLVHWLPLMQQHLSSQLKIQVHIYGNPLKRMKRLQNSSLDLPKLNLSFVVGSKVQEDLFVSILNSPDNVTYAPFIPTDRFHTSDEVRKNWRKANHFSDEKLFLYTGRISYQKNVHHLLELFSIHSKSNPKSRLIIVGTPDNLNWREVPRANYLNYSGELFFERLRILQERGVPVTYLGKLEASELLEVYNGCDHFVSMSTFDGEDFGLSVAEALAAGLPCSLTSWGGYKEFRALSQVKLCAIELRDGTLGVDYDGFMESLNSLSSDKKSNAQEFSQWKKERVNQCLHVISTLKTAPFKGFTTKFEQYCADQTSKGEFFEKDKEFLSAYWA